jgi:Chaperone of endosialidase
MLTALRAQENVVPLRNWDSARYWHPNQSEREAVVKPVPLGAPPATHVVNLSFVAMTPCRLVDTRGAAIGFDGISPFSGPSIAPSATVTFPVQSASSNTTPAPCGAIPSVAAAYSLNVTVIPHAGASVVFVTVWPDGMSQPVVSTLDDTQGKVVANAAIVAAGTPNGGISLFNYGPAIIDVVIDMNGYFAAPTDLAGNTAIGAGTLLVNSGQNNTATGNNALAANTTGIANTATGAGALTANTTGAANTAIGAGALADNLIGTSNTATGAGALAANKGSNNTANGVGALNFNTSGIDNTATGVSALAANTTSSNNTAYGFSALQNNTASNNTATGFEALQANIGGASNTATGYQALQTNTTGVSNTAAGIQALQANNGIKNTASGAFALVQNTSGGANTSSGWVAMGANTTGSNNVASGAGALGDNTSGSGNVAIGYFAGSAAPAGNSDSTYINSGGNGADNSGTIQIGTSAAETTGTITIGSNQVGGTFIAGILGANVGGSGAGVFINSSGQLGTLLSSQRFKEQITDMGDSSSKLLQLRPVSFFYKPEYDGGSHQPQYGLIAEEVAKVYPEMVVYDKHGEILSVKYQLLAPMLLNELQKQAEENVKQAQDIRSLEDRLAAIEAGLVNAAPAGAQPVH